jgi:uncharacterized protein (TIGR02466 family)
MDSATPPAKVQIRPVFPTFVAEIDHPDPAPLNALLLAYIRRIRDESPPEQRATTIRQGWRSKADLLEHDVPEVRSLRAFLDQSIQLYVNQWVNQSGAPQASRKLTHRYKGWAVILSEHGYQHQHVHSRTDLVGVYCVQRPETQTPGGDPGGALTLIDPCTGRLSTRTSWESDVVSLQPVPGRLILIPSFVAHRVEAVTVPGERITINLDVIVVERS